MTVSGLAVREVQSLSICCDPSRVVRCSEVLFKVDFWKVNEVFFKVFKVD
jgi:hypothetical protein